MAEKRKFTETMSLHLNGGSTFSKLVYDVLCDGKPTNIVHITETNGSPKYLKTAEEFQCGVDVFDALKSREGLMDWLESHVPKIAEV